jgi:hypothetical protein
MLQTRPSEYLSPKYLCGLEITVAIVASSGRSRSPDRIVYGFLTTAPNAVVEPIHPKAMADDPGDR